MLFNTPPPPQTTASKMTTELNQHIVDVSGIPVATLTTILYKGSGPQVYLLLNQKLDIHNAHCCSSLVNMEGSKGSVL